MNIRDDIKLSEDHKSIFLGGYSWFEMSQKFEDIGYIKPQCEKCALSTFLHCIQFEDVTDRKTNCEMIEGVQIWENMGSNPMPQVGLLAELNEEPEEEKTLTYELVDGKMRIRE
jgi:hypothetical protein